MTPELFTKLMTAVFSIIGILISAYLIPYIKTKMTAQDIEKLVEYAKIAVRCANQIFTPEQWKEKKGYVMQLVQNFMEENLHIKLTEQQIDTIIEGLVNEVKKSDSNS